MEAAGNWSRSSVMTSSGVIMPSSLPVFPTTRSVLRLYLSKSAATSRSSVLGPQEIKGSTESRPRIVRDQIRERHGTYPAVWK